MNYKTVLIVFFLVITGLSTSFAKGNQLEDAQIKAKTEGKFIFMNFSGSDWCRSCMILKKTILESPEFKTFADKNLVLVDVDFPRKKKNRLTAEQTLYNEQLAEKYNKDGQFPTIIIMDSDMNIVAKTGYKNLSPTQYVDHIKSLIE
ncbi:thioredoxin-like protein [Ancylomarina subtilis]|uniref:Thioredoxin-like protein n=1 Tax=Ancylomarina subtilis TaxID=1639035 RepID=A0A4Q7V8N2_9BACT|nr:thioredoxin family protein [Ancylomarina subtilis]RZT91850.1 thioredoxin-like protein [Ancylomarina subtilis]